MNELSLVAVNLTRRCNLACAHCYLDAATLQKDAPDELSTGEVCRLLDQIADSGARPMVVLTGGEPLLRSDVETIAQHGARRGLVVALGTNGTLLTSDRVASLKQSGICGVGVSIDSLVPSYHDAFRGKQGCWTRTMDGIDNCRRLGLDFQLHFSVTEDNRHELPAMVDFAKAGAARALNVFFLICAGRGELLSDLAPETYERILHDLIEVQKRVPELVIRARCAPHFKRIAHQSDPDAPVNRISGSEADACIAGTHYCRVTPEGGVTACPYITREVGNIREQHFMDLWDNASEFARLRDPILTGKCGACEYQKLCGGCRARPVVLGRDLMDADPLCAYVPRDGEVIEPLHEWNCQSVRWSRDAEQRLTRVPTFLRKMVRKRAEAYVLGIGEQVVTTSHMTALAARRFGAPRSESSIVTAAYFSLDRLHE